MNQQAKRIKELFGYARTLTKEQGIGTMCVRAAGFFKRRFFGKRARYWPSNMALEAQRSDPAAETFPIISILTPLYNTPQNFLTEFLDSVENQTATTGSSAWRMLRTMPTPMWGSWCKSTWRPTHAFAM